MQPDQRIDALPTCPCGHTAEQHKAMSARSTCPCGCAPEVGAGEFCHRLIGMVGPTPWVQCKLARHHLIHDLSTPGPNKHSFLSHPVMSGAAADDESAPIGPEGIG